MKGTDFLAGAARATTYNMALQLMIRLMTFFLNAFVLRFISRDLLGIVNVRLMLLYMTITFLSCEAFEKACLSRQENRDWRQTINLAWFTTPVSILFALVLGSVWLFALELPDPDVIPNYTLGVVCYVLSSILESSVDPVWVVGRAHLFVKLKVVLSGICQGTKTVLTITLIYLFPSLGLQAFCIAQLGGAAVYCVLYYIYFGLYGHRSLKKNEDFPIRSFRDCFPRHIPEKPYVDRHTAGLVWSFFKQSFLKQTLTEGERIVMTFMGVLTFADQGVYDVINNLGSMAARFIFQPIEESGNLFFSQLLTRGKTVQQQNQDSVSLCSDVLGYVLKSVTLIGLTILVFGRSYAFLALDLYGGSILSVGSGPFLLRWYCLYVLVIAINGITEGFVFASMSREEVDRYNKKMLVFSGVFLFCAWLFTKLFGSVGFILANCLNMSARIVHSIYFISKYFSKTSTNPLKKGLPSMPAFVSLLLAFFLTYASEKTFCCDQGTKARLIHIAVGALCFIFVLVTMYLSERKLVLFVKGHYNQQRNKSNNEKSE